MDQKENPDFQSSYVSEIRKLLGHRPMIFVAVPVLLLDNQDRVLLQLRMDDNTWCLPGGYMELGESTDETARREVREETGLVVRSLSLLNIFSGSEFYKVFPNGDQVYSVSVAYFSYDFDGELHADGQEVLELKYFSRTNLPPDLTDHAKIILNDFWRTKSKVSNSS